MNVGETMPTLVIYSDLGAPRRFQQMLPQVQFQPRQAVKCFARYATLWYNNIQHVTWWHNVRIKLNKKSEKTCKLDCLVARKNTIISNTQSSLADMFQKPPPFSLGNPRQTAQMQTENNGGGRIHAAHHYLKHLPPNCSPLYICIYKI